MSYSSPTQNPIDSLFAKLATSLRGLFEPRAQNSPIPTRDEELTRDRVGVSSMMLFSHRHFRSLEDHIMVHASALQTRPVLYDDPKLGGGFRAYSQSTRLDNLLYIIALEHAKKNSDSAPNSIKPYIDVLIQHGANPNAIFGEGTEKIIDKIHKINPKTASIMTAAVIAKASGLDYQ